MTNRKASALMGALIADAAALGLHWVYDVERITNAVGQGSAAFVPLDIKHFESKPIFFVHGARKDGMLSQYGEVLALAMTSILKHNGFTTQTYQTDYAAHFGPGGQYQGYIDHPTRGTLANIAREQLDPSGVDDDQHPALATLPAIVARYGADPAQIERAIKVTNVNDDADHYGAIFAQTLAAVLSGTPLKDALKAAANAPDLQAALDTTETSSTEYGAVTRRACHLPQGVPLSWHILNNSSSYQEAIEANVLAGGDSCGRAIIVGALAGAAHGMKGIPHEWMLKLHNGSKHLEDATSFSSF
ncbi:MAG: ADP-ribosylglycohydrolase family protein [Litoreibacter sp.]